MYYTGIGSRGTPLEIGELETKLAEKLEEMGYTLRSGGAQGSDTYFEAGVKKLKEIYIPWKSFGLGIIPEYSEFADRLIQSVHPAYEKLSQGAKKLHLRNVNQVLGQDLNTPSKFLICWAPTDKKGVPKGGTRTAWKIAEMYNIPRFNLAIEEDLERIKKFI